MKSKFITLIFTVIVVFSEAQTWTQKADFKGVKREAGAMCLVKNKIYLGLGGNNTFYNDWYEYDITSNTWTAKKNFPGTARFAPAFFTINDKVYVGCGFNQSFSPLKDFYCYDPLTDNWNQIADFGGGVRGGTMHFSMSNYGFVGTGVNSTFTVQKDIWMYNDSSNLWMEKNKFNGGLRWRMATFILNDTVYAGCGANDSATFSSFWKYNFSSDNWTKIADFPGLPRVSPFGLGVNGKGYVGTGLSMSMVNYQDVFEYTPLTNTWKASANFPGGARNSVASVSNSAVGWLSLGNNGFGWESDLWQLATPTSISDVNQQDPNLFVFPNPAHDVINLTFAPSKNGADFKIVNMTGEIVLMGKLISQISVIDLSNGIYQLCVISNNEVFNKKIIVRH